jgi:hypothetical protein
MLFLHRDEIFTNESLDTFVVSCIVRLGTMSMQMLTTLRIHSRLTDATTTSPALQWPNSYVVEERQPEPGSALVWRRAR